MLLWMQQVLQQIFSSSLLRSRSVGLLKLVLLTNSTFGWNPMEVMGHKVRASSDTRDGKTTMQHVVLMCIK